MKLILQKDVKNLGKTGDQVFVKKGYARNYLIPRKLALPINKDRLKAWKHQNILIEAKKRKALLERKGLIEKLSSLNIEFEKESLKDGKLFGSVTAFEISQTLEKKHNILIDKKDISPFILKTVGDHVITVSLDSEHKTEITVKVKGKVTKNREQTKKDSSPKPETAKEAPTTEEPAQLSEELPEQYSSEVKTEESSPSKIPANKKEQEEKTNKTLVSKKPEEEQILSETKIISSETPANKKETEEKVALEPEKKYPEEENTLEEKASQEKSSSPETSQKKEIKEEKTDIKSKKSKKKKFIFF